MEITAVEKRRKSLCAIYIDGEYALDLDKNVTLEHALNPGQQITDEELYALKSESDLRRAKEKALWLLSLQDYSRKSLRDKLIKDYGEQATESTLDRLEELSLVDDERYARTYAKDLFEIKKLSARAVKYKLIEKGIDRVLAQEITDEYDPDEEQQIYDLLNTKYIRNMFDEKGRRRTISALQRMGYGYSVIRSAFDEFDEENGYTKDDEYYEG